MADSVIASLKDLADHRGVLIMASVHCPSSDAVRPTAPCHHRTKDVFLTP